MGVKGKRRNRYMKGTLVPSQDGAAGDGSGVGGGGRER